MTPTTGPTPPRRRRAAGHRVFVTVAGADLAACLILMKLSLTQGIWLLNLPATVTAGRLAESLGGDLVALAVTVAAGAFIYGWAGFRLATARERRAPRAS